MRVIRLIPAAFVAAVLLCAQTPGISPDRQPDYQALSNAVRTLRHPEVLRRSKTPDGVFTFDLHNDGRE